MNILSKINDFLEKDYKSSVLSGTMIISPYNFTYAPDISTAWVAGGHSTASGYYAYANISSMETYNNTAWVAGASLGASQENGMAGGTKTAAIAAGGYLSSPAPYPNTNKCQTYNGSAWTVVGNLTYARNNLKGQGNGTTSNALCTGGHENGTGNISVSEKWNGSAWSSISYISAWGYYGGMYAGTGSSGVFTVGTSSYTWNGTASSSSGALGTSHTQGAGGGNASAAFVQGGGTGATDIFNGTTWSAGGSTTSRGYSAGGGTSTNGIIMGGLESTYTTAITQCDHYYANTWHSISSLSTARSNPFGCA